MTARFQAKRKVGEGDWRLRALRFFFLAFSLLIVIRLFSLQVVQAEFYHQLASGQHSFYQELFAERGDIYVHDWMGDQEFLAATNEPRAFVFADPRRIENAEETANQLARALGYTLPTTNIAEEETETSLVASNTDGVPSSTDESEEGAEEQNPTEDYEMLLARLSKTDDPYEPIARNLDEETLTRILYLNLEGVDYVLEKTRAYPETNLGGQIFGFVGETQEGQVGQYGLEGFYNDFLAGKNGYINSETDSAGNWIGVGTRVFEPAVDGGDLLLTIDRTVQYTACQILKRGVEKYDAEAGSLVILEPSSGRVLAMCNVPDFDPNTYNQVEDIAVYNNRAVSTPYEPGSVFKPLVMAMALDTGALTPSSRYTDTGGVTIDNHTIRNSDRSANGSQNMTQVLEKSLNTGMVHVMRQMDFDVMKAYIQNFGFGTVTGIGLAGEAQGDISSLNTNAEIYYATASYGQGITSTTLQLAAAYASLANGGLLMQPYLIEEFRHSDGWVEEVKPTPVRQVVSSKTATTIGAMLVSVVENGHGYNAQVPGYYMAGKTGTAQVASAGGYSEDEIMATFTGFGPVDEPQFAMVVTLDNPRAVPWAADSAAPIWGEIADFLVHYFEIPPRRNSR